MAVSCNALPSSGTLQGVWSLLLSRLLVWMGLLEGMGEKCFPTQKAEVEGADSTPVDLLWEDSNPGLVIAQFPVVKTHFGSLPQRELPPERNPPSLPQAPSCLSWAECTYAACRERRCSGSQQCHSRCRGTLEQPLLEREFHLKHKNIRQPVRMHQKRKCVELWMWKMLTHKNPFSHRWEQNSSKVFNPPCTYLSQEKRWGWLQKLPASSPASK